MLRGLTERNDDEAGALGLMPAAAVPDGRAGRRSHVVVVGRGLRRDAARHEHRASGRQWDFGRGVLALERPGPMLVGGAGVVPADEIALLHLETSRLGLG